MDKAQATAAADWHKQVAALNEDRPSKAGTVRERLLTRMDPEVNRSFSEAQLRELERACGGAVAAAGGRHPAHGAGLEAALFHRLAGPTHP